MKNYKLEKIKKDLGMNLERYELLLTAWENVVYKTKKDGQPFKNLSKNFENASYKKKNYGNYYVLEVYTFSNNLGYIDDCIYLNEYRTNEKITDIERIKEMIEKKKQFFKNEISKTNDRINRLDTAFVEFETAYTKALGQLAYDLGCTKEFDSLFYTIRQEVCK